jgi:hypothetical protein
MVQAPFLVGRRRPGRTQMNADSLVHWICVICVHLRLPLVFALHAVRSGRRWLT